MSCTGNGRCMKRCDCKTICSCLDIAHEHIVDGATFCKVYCRHDCKPIHCINPVCKAMCLDSTVQLCNTCHIFKLEYLDKKEECCICYQTKYMVKTHCNHHYCFECLMDDESEVIRCFICRSELLFNPV
jgi:hypothetical protein